MHNPSLSVKPMSSERQLKLYTGCTPKPNRSRIVGLFGFSGQPKYKTPTGCKILWVFLVFRNASRSPLEALPLSHRIEGLA